MVIVPAWAEIAPPLPEVPEPALLDVIVVPFKVSVPLL